MMATPIYRLEACVSMSMLMAWCSWGVAWAVQPPTAAGRPNIVYVLADDMGFSDVGCYGSEIETPRLDALAARGLRFTQFYNAARCCPTRASLLTGLYPHQAGVGWMMADSGYDGYRGELNRQCLTIAEVLKTAGYRTYMTGKWHVTQKVDPTQPGDRDNWPCQRGFDRFYGTIHGAGSFFDPNSLTRDNQIISPYADPEYQPSNGFYYTDAIADHAVRFVSEHQAQTPDQPLFMYVSFTAAHWPMHAREEDIARVRGQYDAGYEAIRAARYQKMLDLGVVEAASTELWPMQESWMEKEYFAWDARNMEVYAAMVASMDSGIGRIIDALRDTGQLDNTLFVYLQDNGGCAEAYGRGPHGAPRAAEPSLPPMAPEALQPDMQPKQTRDGYPVRTGKGVMAGAADTYIGYGRGWATVSNTPFREYKHWTHEGGIATPLIVHWPAGLRRSGELEHAPGHLIDLMATAVDVARAEYPETFHGGNKIKPLEGLSLVPTFTGEKLNREAIYWEHEGNRAVRLGDYKLVAKGKAAEWELYNLAQDRSELEDLAAKQPEVVQQLAALWDAYAERADVLPLTPYQAAPAAAFNKQKLRFQLGQGDDLPRAAAPYIPQRGLSLSASLSDAQDGVIVAQGGTAHGWSVYIQRHHLCFAAVVAGQRTDLLSSVEIHGSGELAVEVAVDGSIAGSWNGAAILHGSMPQLWTEQPVDGLQVGRDDGGQVGKYSVPFKFPGDLRDVAIKLVQ